MSQYETIPVDEVSQIKNLIGVLERSKATLALDIQHEEQAGGVFEPESLRYSPLPKQLRLRRENISATIATLTARLARHDLLQLAE